MARLVGDTLYFDANNGSSGIELWAHQPSEITPLGGGSGSGSGGGMTNVTGATCTVSPSLPAGLSIDSSTCTISGTPSVYAANQTYTVHANLSDGTTLAYEVYLSVGTDNPHTVVEGQAIDPIGFPPPFTNGTTTWTVSPSLPVDLSIDPATGRITGSVNGTMATTTYTVTATHDGGATAGVGRRVA